MRFFDKLRNIFSSQAVDLTPEAKMPAPQTHNEETLSNVSSADLTLINYERDRMAEYERYLPGLMNRK